MDEPDEEELAAMDGDQRELAVRRALKPRAASS